jgi:hypothetical protein
MDKKNTIQEELIQISPLLAALPQVNVYTAPANYFNDFTASILTLVSTSGFMDDVAKYNPSLQVPEAYFDQLADNILSKINTQQPQSLASDAELSNQLLSLRTKKVYETPANYFEDLQENIYLKISAFEDNVKVETNNISPMLAGIDNRNVLTTPLGYFDDLPNLLLQNSKPASKVISMQKRKLFIRFAAAAILIGAISLAIVKFTNKSAEIKGDYATINNSIDKGTKMDDKKFDETLNNLSEEDIATYLQKNGSEADLALLSSSIDESNVPNQDDYLLDEKTLEKFLNEIDTKKMNN